MKYKNDFIFDLRISRCLSQEVDTLQTGTRARGQAGKRVSGHRFIALKLLAQGFVECGQDGYR